MPVDTDTALRQLDALADRAPDHRLAGAGWPRHWQTLIATLLSARTRDDVTIPVATGLFEQYPTLDALAGADRSSIEAIIGRVNYYRTKADYVKGCATQILERHGGRTPTRIEHLVDLPGVGRKTANVFLASAGHPAIGVDTHVARIARRLDWTDEDDPDRIEQSLRDLLPRERWREVNPVLVRFGQGHTRSEEDEVLGEIR